MFGTMFVIFAAIAVGQIASMRGGRVESVFDLMFVLFQGLWVLGWSAGVLILFLLAVLLFFYRESAWIAGARLVHAPRLGPLRFVMEFDLGKIRNLRVVRAGGADRVRIRFDYGDGDHGLGNDLPRAVAERQIEILERAIAAPGPSYAGREAPGLDLTSWVGRQRVLATPKAPPPPAVEPPRAPAEPTSWTSPSALALVAANVVPLAGVLFLGWDLGAVMVLFWAENGVIGVYNLLKLAVVAKWGILFVGPFFTGHFGGFMAAHFLFIYYLFVGGAAAGTPEASVLVTLGEVFTPLWPALLVLVVSHGVSFYTNFLGRQEYRGRNAGEQMAEPYKRVVILHVTIIFGGWVILLLKSAVGALALLVLLKTAVDLAAHRKEHAR